MKQRDFGTRRESVSGKRLRPQLESLEERILLSGDELGWRFDDPGVYPAQSVHRDGGHVAPEAHRDAGGRVYYAEPPGEFAAGPEEAPPTDGWGAYYSGNYDLSKTFLLESDPGANLTIYLDFDGHLTTGAPWNNGTPFNTPAWSLDGDRTTFTDIEKTTIQRIWARVAEDFMPWEVNVTTKDPGIEALRKTNFDDQAYGVRVVIGENTIFGPIGGIAYIGSFDWDSDTPVFVFNASEKGVSEAASHEVGHAVDLLHDGTATEGYYAGHGGGDTGWAPIMGVGYYQNLSQWSMGEYNGANLKENDLSIINSYLPYRPDDHGNSMATSTVLLPQGQSTVPETFGLIEQTRDVDVFSFYAGTGLLSLDVETVVVGPNLDVKAELLNSQGWVIATGNPGGSLSVDFDVSIPAPGQYFLRVDGTGKGEPTQTGYSEYASLGTYRIKGTIPAFTAVTNQTPVAVADTITTNEDTAVTFNVLTNDSDPDNDPLTLLHYTAPSNGRVRRVGNTLAYTPLPNFFGQDRFSYSVGDGKGGVSGAVVTVTVLSVNDAPVAVNDSYSAIAGRALVVPASGVLVNDQDTDNLVGLFREDFEGLPLRPFQSPTESGGDGTDWVNLLGAQLGGGLAGWTEDPMATPIGNPVEFYGWTLMDADSWVATEANQGRSGFTKGGVGQRGTILVADPDAYDDGTNVDTDLFDASISTRAISLENVLPNSVTVTFDSSWQSDPGMNVRLEVSYDGEAPITLFTWTGDAGANFKPTAVNETVSLAVANPAGARSMKLTWVMFDSENNWWWGIDNILVTGRTGVVTLLSEDFENFALQPYQSGTERIDNDLTDWTPALPTGWTRDNSNTPIGDPVEFRGWNIHDADSWVATEADQGRNYFARGGVGAHGNMIVADGDAYDDGTDVDPNQYNVFLTTSAMSLTGLNPRTLWMTFDSSYWSDGGQTGTVEVRANGGPWTTVFTRGVVDLRNEAVSIDVGSQVSFAEGDNIQFRFGNAGGGNDYWWAIDNVRVTAQRQPPALTAIKVSNPANGTVEVNSNGSFTYTANPSFTGIDSFTYAAVDSDGLQGNTATVSFTVNALADLSLTNVGSTSTANTGGTVVFTITVRNAGPSTASGVAVLDRLPASFSLVGNATVTGDPATTINTSAGDGNDILVSNMDLASGGVVTIVFTANVGATTGAIVNVAEVVAAGQPDPDSTPGNNVSGEDDQAEFTVTVSIPTDTTPPKLISIVDSDADNLVPANVPLTYVVTFSEDIADSGSGNFTSADLDNAGTATITIGTIAETSAGVFSVQVTPTSGGTLVLRIPTSAVVKDVAGNDLVVPVQDDDSLTVDAVAPTVSIDDGDPDNLVPVNVTMTYTLTFSEDIADSGTGSLTSADLDNAGTAAITIGTITESTPGVFLVQVTPTTAGTVILRLPSGAVVTDVAGNAAVVPVLDNDTVTATITFQVTSTTLLSGGAGFLVGFNAPYDVSALNLYTGAAGGTLDARDVQVVGPGGNFGVDARDELRFNAIAVSSTELALVLTGVNRVAAAQVLAAGDYTLTLIAGSGNPAFRRLSDGAFLDGNGDAAVTTVDNYVVTLTVTAIPASTVVVNVATVVAGPGQSVLVPLVLSGGAGSVSDTTSVSLAIANTTTLTVSGFTLNPTIAGATANFNAATGLLTVSSTIPLAITDAPLLLGSFTVEVAGLGNAGVAQPVGTKSLLDITVTGATNAALGPKAFVGVDGFHVNAYIGDLGGSGVYSGSDTSQLQALITQIVKGLALYQNADPLLIADVNKDGNVNGQDVSNLQARITNPSGGLSVIPPLPAGAAGVATGGLDPWTYFDTTGIALRPGQTGVLVPLRLRNTDGKAISLAFADYAVEFDPAVFTITGVFTATATNGSLPTPSGARSSSFGVNWAVGPGVTSSALRTLRITGSTAVNTGAALVVGQDEVVYSVRLDVQSNASGKSSLNILDETDGTGLGDNGGNALVLIPSPSRGIDMGIDAVFVLLPPVAVMKAPPGVGGALVSSGGQVKDQAFVSMSSVASWGRRGFVASELAAALQVGRSHGIIKYRGCLEHGSELGLPQTASQLLFCVHRSSVKGWLNTEGLWRLEEGSFRTHGKGLKR